MAGLGYFRTNKTHTSSQEELAWQNEIVKNILREKGFPDQFIKELANTSKKEKRESKRYTGVTVFDEISKRHIFVKKVFSKSIIDKDKFHLPADIPGKKLEQYIFTVKKMRNQLNF